MTAHVVLAVLTGTLTLLSAGVLALINSGISARAGIDENFRAERLKAYPTLWKASEAGARCPRKDVTPASLGELHRDLRSWYFSNGGLFLFDTARARYGDVQQQISALLQESDDCTHRLGPARDSDLMETTSALRTALTEDLDTRRRKSRWEKRRRARWHAQAAQLARTRIRAAAEDDNPFTPEPG